MKNLIVVLLLSLFVKTGFAQGIHFEDGNWEQVVAVAKQQNKPIFIDVYTAWCGPCKVMAKNIFPVKEVGDKFNTSFVNYKIDAEKGEGIELAKKYEVRAFPTFLVIDPKNERLIHKEVGAMSINEFMVMVDVALQKGGHMTKGKTAAEFEQAYLAGERSPEFLLAYMKQNIVEKKENGQLADTLFAYLPESKRLQQPYIGYLALNVSAVESPLFGFLASQHEAVSQAINPGDQLFFESAMIGASRSLSRYKGAPNPQIAQNMEGFRALLGSKKVMIESYYYSPLGSYFKNMKDTVGFMKMAKDYGQTIIFKTTRAAMEEVDRAAIADAQAKLNSGEVDSAYFKAKTRNPHTNQEQAAIRTSNLAFDVARLATSKSDKKYAVKLIKQARSIHPNMNNTVMLAAILQLTGHKKDAKKALAKAIAEDKENEANILKRFESLTSPRK